MDKYLPVGITLLTILSNAFGNNIKEISDKYKPSSDNITPAPFTFSIWGLIYGLLIYTTFVNYKDIYIQTQFESIFILFIISAVLNGLWIQVWGKNLELSSVILILLAFVLVIITIELNKANADKILIYAFGIYTAWVIIASLLNLSTVLINNNILDSKTTKLIMVGILTLLPFFIGIFKNNLPLIPIFITFIWGIFGIIMNGENNLIFILPLLTSIINILL